MKITIINLQKRIPVKATRLKAIALKVLSKEGAKKTCAVNFLFVTDKQIREFNRMYLGRDCPTDVIAFDTGDIVISSDTAIRNSGIFKTTPLSEIYLYVIHGLLHLLGYKDNNKKNRAIMCSREKFHLLYAHPKN